MSTKTKHLSNKPDAALRALAAKSRLAGFHGAIFVGPAGDVEESMPNIDQTLAVVRADRFSHILDKVVADPGRHSGFPQYFEEDATKQRDYRLADLEGQIRAYLNKGIERLTGHALVFVSYSDSYSVGESDPGIAASEQPLGSLLEKQIESPSAKQTPRDLLKDKAIAAVVRLIEKASEDTCLHSLSAPDEASALVSFLASPEIAGVFATETRDPLAAAMARGVAQRKSLLEAEGGTASGVEIAEMLGISRQAVDKRRRNGRMLAIPTGNNDWRYPRWQIQDQKVLDGFDKVMVALTQLGPWTKLQFFLTPDERLNGERPLDLIRRGDVEQVIKCAEGLEEHGAH